MKTKLTYLAPAFALGAALTVSSFAQEKTTRAFTAAQLNERTIHRRAVEAIIWGIPAVNYDLMFQSMVRDASGSMNQILFWSGLPDWKNQYLTPNPDTIYFMPFFSTKDVGPMVLEIPPADDGSITGTIMDCWQMALEDAGPAGADKGKGGKYLILPPGYMDKAPEGYIALPLFDQRYETIYEPHNKGTHWFLPADKDLMESVESSFTKTDVYPTDGRGILFYFAYTTVKHLGAGQFYLFVSRDKDGNPLNGARTYRLHVPPKPPVKQYWSAVLYDFATHALIRDMASASSSSQSPGLQTNADGSVDVYFAPKAPAGKESNWIPTDAKGRFEALFRFYGPEKPLFEKTWVLPDIEPVK